jgi:hypothetical protein
MSAAPDHLDEAYEALRWWCHIRPDRDDPSTIYAVLGSITRIVASLAHIVDVVSDSARRATGSDDGRTVDCACDEIGSAAELAVYALHEVNQAISEAHEVVAHLIFAVDDQV